MIWRIIIGAIAGEFFHFFAYALGTANSLNITVYLDNFGSNGDEALLLVGLGGLAGFCWSQIAKEND